MVTYDLTDLTGVGADTGRTQMLGGWQIPAVYVMPGIICVFAGILVGLVLWPFLGPGAMIMLFITPAVGVWFLVDEVEAPWKRLLKRLRARDRSFSYCGLPLDLHPTRFIRVVPSSAPPGR